MAFTDTFTEGSDTNLESHTPSGGTAWTRVDGAAGAAVVNAANDALHAASATNTMYRCDDQGSADQYVQYKVSSLNDNVSFVCNRATDANNFIGVRVNATKIELFKRVTGTFTQLGVDGTTTVVVTDVIKLESEGDDHRVYINGNLEITRTDTAHNTVTRQGVCIRGTQGHWIDDFEAGVLANTEALTTSASTGGQTAPSLTTSVPL
jgi:hypothetical protein